MNLDPSAFLADADLLKSLQSSAEPVDCASERVLFRRGDPPTGLYILRSGKVTLSMQSEFGVPILSVSALPGSLLGLPGLLGNEPYSLTAMAQAGADVGFIARDRFLFLMRNNIQISMLVLQVLAAEVRSARNALRDR